MTLQVREYLQSRISTPELITLLEELGRDVRELLLDDLDAYRDFNIVKILDKMGHDTKGIEL